MLDNTEETPVESQEVVTTNDVSEAPQQVVSQPVVPSDPLTPEARALLNNDSLRGLNELLDHTRTSATAPLRGKIADLQKQLADAKQSAETASARDVEAASSSAVELTDRISSLEANVSSLAELLRESTVSNIRSSILATIPADVLPPELHSLVKGSSKEEIEQSIRDAVEIYSAIKSKHAVTQSQAVVSAPQVPQVPQVQNPTVGLDNPGNTGFSEQQSPDNDLFTLTNLTQRALRSRNREEREKALQQGQDILQAELKRQGLR